MAQIKKRNSILNSLSTGTTIDLDNNAAEQNEKDQEELSSAISNNENKTEKQAKGKNKKAAFILDILDKDVNFDIRKTKFVTSEISERIRLLSTLTGKSEQIIMHSILEQIFQRKRKQHKAVVKRINVILL